MKQVAGIPITSFDHTKIDSDLDTVRSEAVRGKIAEYRHQKKQEPEDLKYRSKSIETGGRRMQLMKEFSDEIPVFTASAKK